MHLTRLSTKSQVVIPASIRKTLGLQPGDQVEIDVEGERITIRRIQGSALDQLGECVSDVWKGYGTELESMREEWDN